MIKFIPFLLAIACTNDYEFQDRFNEALSFEEHAEYSVTYSIGDRMYIVPESDAWFMYCDVADVETNTYYCTRESNINKSPSVQP